MYYDPYYINDPWYVDEYYDPRQQPQFQILPEFGPPMQPPAMTLPEFGRPPRPRPPFIPSTPPWQDHTQGLWRCLNRVTLIHLVNGRSIYFYPTNITNTRVIGFRWRGNNWVRDSIERRNILYFDCQF